MKTTVDVGGLLGAGDHGTGVHAREAAVPEARGAGRASGFAEAMSSNDLQTQRRLYPAGNRTYWHTHEKGFLVESGHARAQKRGEPMRELGPGDVDYTPPNVLHWHGAAPNDDFVQVGLLFGGGITFADPVTDAEYNGRK